VTLPAQLAAILGTGVVYGTDVFCAPVQRPALARVDDATLTAIMGNMHRNGDRRMPAPGILGVIAAAASAIAAVVGHLAESVTAGVAFLLLAASRQLRGRAPRGRLARGACARARPRPGSTSPTACSPRPSPTPSRTAPASPARSSRAPPSPRPATAPATNTDRARLLEEEVREGSVVVERDVRIPTRDNQIQRLIISRDLARS
jgi:hypothetical protein